MINSTQIIPSKILTAGTWKWCFFVQKESPLHHLFGRNLDFVVGALQQNSPKPCFYKRKVYTFTLQKFKMDILCKLIFLVPWKRKFIWAMKKIACLGYIGDDKLPSYVGIIISHSKDPGSRLNNQYISWNVVPGFVPWLMNVDFIFGTYSMFNVQTFNVLVGFIQGKPSPFVTVTTRMMVQVLGLETSKIEKKIFQDVVFTTHARNP